MKILQFIILILGCLFINTEGLPTTEENQQNYFIRGGVVGGMDAPKGRIPYQASLRTNSNWNICGGTILSSRWVLTAAHCTVGLSPNNFKVVVGTNDLTSGGDSYSVESILIHEEYTNVYNGNDISLIKLSTDIAFNDLVKSIKLPAENTSAGVNATASGWGRISKEGKRTTNLQMIELTTLSVEHCQKELNGKYPVYDSQICTLTKTGEGTCRGDSGGPLVSADGVIGVISWGEPCAIGFPDVYTRVYAFKDWIQEKMSN